jgi:hypothetical protein
MKNYMKKIIVGFLALAFLVVGHSAFASGPFNGQSGDCQNINIGNYTTGTGIGDGQWGCWTRTSITASAGDTINVVLFYHNNTNNTLTNVGATLSQSSSGPGTNFTFSGNVTSDQGSTNLGTVSLNLNSSQTVTYNSVHWMKDRQAIDSDTDTPLPFGQSSSVMQNGGKISLGSVPPGWDDYGELLIVFKVGNNTPPPPQVCQDTNATNYGGPLPCTYPQPKCMDTNATNYGGALPCTYPQPKCMDTNATNYGGPLPCTYPQKCQDPSATNYGGALPCTYPQPKCMDYNATNYGGALPCTYPQPKCTDYNATNYGGPLPCNYPLKCQDPSATNYGGALPCTYPQPKCMDYNATNYGGALPCQYPQKCQDRNATNYGGSLPCQYPQKCQDPSATNYGGSLPCKYPQPKCMDTTATNYGGSLPCQYPQLNCTISNFLVNGSTSTTVQSGASVNLVWNTNDCIYVSVSGPNFSSSTKNGTENAYPPNNGVNTYTITATGANGSTQTKTVTVYVNQQQTSYCNINSFTANGSTAATIQSGNPVTISWNTTDCTSVSVSGPGLNDYAQNGSRQVYPTNSTTYIITASGQNGGQQQKTVYVNVNPLILPPPPPPIPIYNACAVTTVATNVSRNGAQVNGLVTSNGSSSAYFEYGTTASLGLQTQPRQVNGPYYEILSGLNAGTTYYFRSVANCGNGGTSRGTIETFTTLSNPVVTTTTTTTVPTTTTRVVRQIVQGTTVVGTESPIMLHIENRYQYIGVGDTIDYVVTYKNIGSALLTHPILQVVVPKGIVLTNASRGTYSIETNTLTVQLEDLYPGAEGVVYAQGHVEVMPENTAQIVTTAILVYTSPNGAQENAIAYVLNNPKDLTNVLGASAFFAGIFPGSLLGWLLLIILILIILLIARSFSRRPVMASRTTTTTVTQPPIAPQMHF